jgi:hypothetical protein
LGSRSGEGFGFGGFGLGRSYSGPSDGDVTQSSSGAVGLIFSNHRGCESRVVGKPSIGDGIVKGFGRRGSECSGCVED